MYPNETLRKAILYLSRRQIDNRPTTVSQLSTTLRLSSRFLLELLDREKIPYLLIHHGAANRTTQIVLICIPDHMLEQVQIMWKGKSIVPTGVTQENIHESYQQIIKDNSSHEYEILKNDLISWNQLLEEAVKQGYSREQIWRSAISIWHPYKVGNKNYYHKRVLKSLNDSWKTYKNPERGIALYNKRAKKLGLKKIERSSFDGSYPKEILKRYQPR